MKVVPKEEVFERITEGDRSIFLVFTENGKHYLYDNDDIGNMQCEEFVSKIDDSHAVFLAD
jgi:hypothetical protein